MNPKRTAILTLLSACLIIFIVIYASAPSAIASIDNNSSSDSSYHLADSMINNALAISNLDTDTNNFATDKKVLIVIHESADILHYKDGVPYIHDILTNNTNKTIIEQ